MNNAFLKEHLKTLHQELTTIGAVDEDSQRLLEKIRDDVQFLLSHKSDAPLPRHATVKERLAESARHFNASHPALAATIRTVVNTLNTMGI
jgi:Domain of unknown function (DUF4404)